jgi:Protein of unknown function (DUF1761)
LEPEIEGAMTLNYGMILAAAIASYAFGAAWYMGLSKQWMEAQETTKAALDKRHTVAWLPFAVSFVAQLLMAYLLAGVIVHMARSGISLSARSGVISALFIWAGFVMTTMVTNNAFQGRRWMLSVIDGAHWLGVLIIQGAIIGAYGFRG